LESLFIKELAISSWKATRHSCQAELGSDKYEARTDGMSQHQNTGNSQAVVEANRKTESMKQLESEYKNPQKWLPGL
jgi:hypothetical protein